jgi:diaminohydroxyphosphoribosylaminopyrimidine deaminase/5-amino-6-(5-phosphoribosylamino)uracil reductase
VLAYIAPVLLGGSKLALTDIGVASIAAARRLTVDEWLPLGADLLAIAHPAVDLEEGVA